MPTHGLAPAHEGSGSGRRKLDVQSVEVTNNDATFTNWSNISHAFANAFEDGDYSVNVYKLGSTAGGTYIYFKVYNHDGSTQDSAVTVDYLALAER